MEFHDLSPRPLQQPPPPFQFGILSIFGLTAVVAVFVTIVFVLPDPIAGPVMLASYPISVACVSLVCVLRRGWVRAFAFGVLVPVSLLAIGLGFWIGVLLYEVIERGSIGGSRVDDPELWSQILRNIAPALRFWIGWTSAVSLLSGLVCVAVSAWLTAGRRAD